MLHLQNWIRDIRFLAGERKSVVLLPFVVSLPCSEAFIKVNINKVLGLVVIYFFDMTPCGFPYMGL